MALRSTRDGWTRSYRFGALAVAVVGVVAAACLGVTPAGASTGSDPGEPLPTTLRAAAALTGRHFGVAVNHAPLNQPVYTDIVEREFDTITVENALKIDATEPARGVFNFTVADRILTQFPQKRLHGHTLVWHSGMPSWFQSLAGQALRTAMNNHITGVMAHYRGRAYAWDVVNEAFNETGGRRSSSFQSQLGDGYIEEAFRTARAADPEAKLCYSDYFAEDLTTAKGAAVFAMVKDFVERGVPIDCIGLQAHFTSQWPVPATFQNTLEQYGALGVDVELTQLDIGGPASAQAEKYAQVVRACLAVPRCTTITVHGVRDSDSWRASDQPLLFTSTGAKKPAYDAVLAALGGEPTEPTEPTAPPTTTPPPTPTCEATFTLNRTGRRSFSGVVTITPGSVGISGWAVDLLLPPGSTVLGVRSGVLTGTTVTPGPYNSVVGPGRTTSFAFQASGSPAGAGVRGCTAT